MSNLLLSLDRRNKSPQHTARDAVQPIALRSVVAPAGWIVVKQQSNGWRRSVPVFRRRAILRAPQ